MSKKEFFEYVLEFAKQGNAMAQFNIGLMYYDGDGVSQDYIKAIEWWKKSAEQEFAMAQYCLGWMYSSGNGVELDNNKAFEWCKKAAEQGFVKAQNCLAWMYSNGIGVKQNYNKSFEWYEKAAKQGYAEAQYCLGWMYSNGTGVKPDNNKAFEWYKRATEHGLVQARPMAGWYDDQYLLSRFYFMENQYREQDGYAIVLGEKLHYWLYDTVTNKEYHKGDSSIIYNRIIPKWIEKMDYVIDYDNIVVTEPNGDLATSVRALMKQRGANISVTLFTYGKPHFVVINEYLSDKNYYKTTTYNLYK